MTTGLSENYAKASWDRALIGCADADRVGVGFALDDGTMMRIALDVESARQIAEGLLVSLGQLVGLSNHFDIDSAMIEYLSIRGGADDASPDASVGGSEGLVHRRSDGVEVPYAVGAMEKHLRVSLSCNEAGDIEVFSCETQTMLVLPKRDVQLLIDGLMSLDQMPSSREIISLDPSS